MKLYIAEYLAETTHLDAIGHGAYLLLIMAMWRAGGKLPRDEAKLARIAQCTPDQWASVRDDVMAFFKVSGGSIRHNRVSKEIAKYDAVIEGAKSAGKASASKRANKNNAEGVNVRSENVERKSNQPEPEEDNRSPISPKGDTAALSPKIVLRQADVELAWTVTPPRARQRTSKADILKALQGAARRGHQPAAVIEGLRAYYASAEATKDGGEFAKGAHRMITADRWLGFVDGATPLEALASSSPADPLESWRRRVNAFVNGSRFWNPTDWGPEPGRPRCRVPVEIQREFGFTPAQPEEVAA
ncbi:uncharacterized protein YdaU (DUF1376 family) [Caulobacter sp. BE264]|uniref:YdaU family protein n=1 Tax=Caulobacter sp. BE264 TaxID=2817724 RepID=UPI0028645B72|nr:DUF1376 domain-containing protein [Caulobacter sp. BE264]MDR7232811.1 uncharacterized protein YdaU (DUF1376 family) [Caulobacter sp. BE264]